MARDAAYFQRRGSFTECFRDTFDDEKRLVLTLMGHGRNLKRTECEGFGRASSNFTFDPLTEDPMADLGTAWTDNINAGLADLKTALDAALVAAGYTLL